MISVNARGFAALDLALRQLPHEMAEKIVDRAMRQGARVIQDEARRRVPVASGTTRDAIRVRRQRKTKTGVLFQIYTTRKAWWARFVENGTKPHRIMVRRRGSVGFSRRTRKARELGWDESAVQTATDVFLQTAGVHQVGHAKAVLADEEAGVIFGMVVEHPGAKRQPFMRPALDTKAQEAIDTVGQSVGRALKRWARERHRAGRRGRR